jgi:hypothetical protein
MDKSLSPELLIISASKKNRIFLLILIAITCSVYLLDLSLGGRSGLFTEVLAVLTIRQALETYIVVTVFMGTRLEHRSIFGVWRTAEYSKLLVLSGWPGAIRLVGEDTQGKSIKISISKMDGDLEAISAFMKFASDHKKNLPDLDVSTA